MSDSVRYEFEMGFTHAEFLRLVPRAFPHGNAVVVQSDQQTQITAKDGDKTVTITLGPIQARRIASVSFPYVKAVFTFDGYTPEAAKIRLDRIMLSYQKGGG